MDPFTHALSGALLARATASSQLQSPPERTGLPLRLQIATGFGAAVFPDVDLVLRLIDTLTYLNWHQGPTHSLILLPFWAWGLAKLFSWLTGNRYYWQLFFPATCCGIAIHIAGDFFTSYGLMLYAPFSTERFSLPLVFVIDIWFTLIMIAGLIASWRFPSRKIPAVLALGGLVGYGIFLWMLQRQAIEIGTRYADVHTLPHAQIDVLPQPLSLFHWKIIIQYNEVYHVTNIDLRHPDNHRQSSTHSWLLTKMAAAYQADTKNNWEVYPRFGEDPIKSEFAKEAWLQPAFESFRAFAVFPVLERIDTAEVISCAWFYDIRFKFPELSPSFRYGMCRQDDSSPWQKVRGRGMFYID
jgi:inner membrane protein